MMSSGQQDEEFASSADEMVSSEQPSGPLHDMKLYNDSDDDDESSGRLQENEFYEASETWADSTTPSFESVAGDAAIKDDVGGLLSGFQSVALGEVAQTSPKYQPTTDSASTDVPNDGMKNAAINFAMEHRIFLRAILELLAQRDQNATVVGMNDPNILKSGPLKKASHLMRGIWKVKFVEIRRGMFSYYENAVSKDSKRDGELLRKNIPLEANACQCRAVKLHQKALNITPGGAIFELSVNGSFKRLWMANSREERQAWIQAINNAMVGGSVTRGGSASDMHGKSGGVSSKSPYKDDLRKYLQVQNALKNAKSKQEYVGTFGTLLDQPLNVPVKWIIEQVGESSSSRRTNAFHEGGIKGSIDQLWKDLVRDSVKINDELLVGDSGNAPERMIGALTRSIMSLGRSTSTNTSIQKFDINESQALAYSRDVLLSGNRTRTGGDSYFCLDTLCSNPDLVVLVPGSSEVQPVSITVSQDNADDSSIYDIHAKTGWLRTKKKSQKSWRKRFFVLSQGILTFYEKALPRPHKLEGQVVITDANISVTREDPGGEGRLHRGYFVVSVVTKDGAKDRQLLFESEEKLLVWTYALECTAKVKTGAEPAPLMNAVKNVFRKRLGTTKDDDAGSPKTEQKSIAEVSLEGLVADIGLDPDVLESRLANYASRSCSTVKISVEALTEYKICTTDPQGEEREDTWATINATFLQDFRVSGGTNGRIVRGEEIVQVDVIDCPIADISQKDDGLERDPSPSNRTRIRVPGRFPSTDKAGADRDGSPSNRSRIRVPGRESSPSNRSRVRVPGRFQTAERDLSPSHNRTRLPALFRTVSGEEMP